MLNRTLLSFPGHKIHWILSDKSGSSNNSVSVFIKNCIMKQDAVFDIYGHITFENCYFNGSFPLPIFTFHLHRSKDITFKNCYFNGGIPRPIFTFHLHRSKDDSKQIDSSPTEPKKVLKMIQCKTYDVWTFTSS